MLAAGPPVPPPSDHGRKPAPAPSCCGRSRYRNYRLFFGGQVVSLAGTWITTTATSWLVYRLTGSALAARRRRLRRASSRRSCSARSPASSSTAGTATACSSSTQTDLDAAVVRAGRADAVAAASPSSAIVALNVVQGLVNAFDMPARQAFLITMIENKEDLGNAIALNSSMVNLARLLGPSIAGVVIAATNEGWCFLIDGVSYLRCHRRAARDADRAATPADRAARQARWQQFIEGLDATRSASVRSARSSCCSRSSAWSACRTRC